MNHSNQENKESRKGHSRCGCSHRVGCSVFCSPPGGLFLDLIRDTVKEVLNEILIENPPTISINVVKDGLEDALAAMDSEGTGIIC